MLEGSGLYGYGDTPPRPKTSASKSGRRVLPGYSHAQTLDALRSLVAQTNAQADALDRQNRRLQTQAETLRAYVPKTYATVTTQTDPMQPTMTVFNSKTMKPYTVSMATYQKNYNKGNIEMDADGRPVFVAKAHRDANKMIADQEMEDYINELLADMPEPEGAGRSSDSRSEIQAAGFPADEWTPAQARKWMTEHGAKPIKGMRREGTWLRWRITPPDLYGSYTTKTLKSNGKTVHLILGWL
jgi:membrane-bound lytic murein transglycosylase